MTYSTSLRVCMPVLLAVLVSCTFSPDAAIEAFYNCGPETQIKTVYQGNDLTLIHGQDTYALKATVSASGARYETTAGAATPVLFWGKGDTALLEINGQTYPECKHVDLGFPFQETDMRAAGNEPFWHAHMNLEDKSVTITRPDSAPTRHAVTDVARTPDTTSFHFNGGTLAFTRAKTPCQDSMSGQYAAFTTHLTLDNHVMSGCGGTAE